MRLGILDDGHGLKHKAMFAMIRVLSRRAVPGVIKTLTYRQPFFGGQMNPYFQEVMRGSSEWTIGERELMASFVSKTNECEF